MNISDLTSVQSTDTYWEHADVTQVNSSQLPIWAQIWALILQYDLSEWIIDENINGVYKRKLFYPLWQFMVSQDGFARNNVTAESGGHYCVFNMRNMGAHL